MKITWLGQAGLLFETETTSVMIDPYFSNSCQKLNPASFRRVPVDESVYALTPDVIVCTHDHQDHYDEESLDPFLLDKTGVTCIVPPSVFPKIRHYGPGHNYVWFVPGTEWTQGDVRLCCVPAVHSDPFAMGVILKAEGKTYYVTGDTLYNRNIFSSLPAKIDVIFVPVNGVGNNMNFDDARRFIKKSGAKQAVPLHLGMLDDRSVTEFTGDNVVTPELFKEINV